MYTGEFAPVHACLPKKARCISWRMVCLHMAGRRRGIYIYIYIYIWIVGAARCVRERGLQVSDRYFVVTRCHAMCLFTVRMRVLKTKTARACKGELELFQRLTAVRIHIT